MRKISILKNVEITIKCLKLIENVDSSQNKSYCHCNVENCLYCLKYVDIGRQGMKRLETFEILSINFVCRGGCGWNCLKLFFSRIASRRSHRFIVFFQRPQPSEMDTSRHKQPSSFRHFHLVIFPLFSQVTLTHGHAES